MNNNKKIKCKKMCCVVNCHNTYQTGHKLFRFPNRSYERELKSKWINSIKRIKYVYDFSVFIFNNFQ